MGYGFLGLNNVKLQSGRKTESECARFSALGTARHLSHLEEVLVGVQVHAGCIVGLD